MAIPSTSWTILAEATLSGGEVERRALEKFCERYYQPVCIVIRAQGVSEDCAQDLVQEFFMRMMKGSFFRRALHRKGKFRNFLLTTLQNFLVDDSRRANAMKRGGEFERVELREDVSFSEENQLKYDWAWANTLFDAAVELTGQEVKEKRGEAGWKMLRSFVSGEGELSSYEELGRALDRGMGGPNWARGSRWP